MRKVILRLVWVHGHPPWARATTRSTGHAATDLFNPRNPIQHRPPPLRLRATGRERSGFYRDREWLSARQLQRTSAASKHHAATHDLTKRMRNKALKALPRKEKALDQSVATPPAHAVCSVCRRPTAARARSLRPACRASSRCRNRARLRHGSSLCGLGSLASSLCVEDRVGGVVVPLHAAARKDGS